MRMVGRARVGLFVLRECDAGFAKTMLACSEGWGVVSPHAHAFLVERWAMELCMFALRPTRIRTRQDAMRVGAPESDSGAWGVCMPEMDRDLGLDSGPFKGLARLAEGANGSAAPFDSASKLSVGLGHSR